MQKVPNDRTAPGKEINWQPSNLEDPLIQLIPLEPAHFEQLFSVASDPLIWEQHPDKNRYQLDVFRNFFDAAIDSGTAFLIVDKASGTAIGSTRYYDHKPGESSVAIGFTFLGRNFWGGPYNRSVKTVMLDYAFQYVDRVFFHIGAHNIRSQIAIMKLGGIKIREMDFLLNGQTLSHFEFVIQKGLL